MNAWRQKGHDEHKEETPPYSRIFVVCDKQFNEKDLQEPFEKFGTIENLYMPRDRHTGESKGVAYIKYTMTSSAAAAIQALHMKSLSPGSNKPIKVMIANQKKDRDANVNENKNKRLFIMISKNDTEESVREHFSTFGAVQSIYIQKNKGKFAYVTFGSFLEAAKAFEQCDQRFKAVFAIPRDEIKRNNDYLEHGSSTMSNNSLNSKPVYQNYGSKIIKNDNSGFKKVCATIKPDLPEKFVNRLFNLIPGMVSFQYSNDLYNCVAKAIIVYEEHHYAAFAVERLNNFEFPTGEIVTVIPDTIITKTAEDLTQIVSSLKNAVDTGSSPSDLAQLADALVYASSLIKEASGGPEPQENGYCDVALPPVQPMADNSATVVKRCFIVCKPQPPPITILNNIFCRFGNLIGINTFLSKSFGYVNYASEESAMEAIKVLHGARVCGMRIKVLVADDKDQTDDTNRKRKRVDEDN